MLSHPRPGTRPSPTAARRGWSVRVAVAALALSSSSPTSRWVGLGQVGGTPASSAADCPGQRGQGGGQEWSGGREACIMHLGSHTVGCSQQLWTVCGAQRPCLAAPHPVPCSCSTLCRAAVLDTPLEGRAAKQPHREQRARLCSHHPPTHALTHTHTLTHTYIQTHTHTHTHTNCAVPAPFP